MYQHGTGRLDCLNLFAVIANPNTAYCLELQRQKDLLKRSAEPLNLDSSGFPIIAADATLTAILSGCETGTKKQRVTSEQDKSNETGEKTYTNL